MPTSYIPRIHCWRVRVVPRSCTRRGMRTWFAFDRNAIDEHLRELTCHQLFDIGVNCCDLLGVTPAENFKTHCGEHTAIMQQCLFNDRFLFLLGECNGRAQELWKTQDGIKVVCCCPDGWHASVAIAPILHACFKMKGYEVAGPYHLGKWSWRSDCICSDCPECMPNEEKNEMIAVVTESW